MNFMPLTRKGGCKVTIFLRDNTHIGKQIASVLMIINQNRAKKATINIKNFLRVIRWSTNGWKHKKKNKTMNYSWEKHQS